MRYVSIKHIVVRSNGLQKYTGKLYFDCGDGFTNIHISILSNQAL